MTKCRVATPPSGFAMQRRELRGKLHAIGQTELLDVEFVGARLYTGPCFVKYNLVLRSVGTPFFRTQLEKLCGRNRYVTTIHAINSAILKLSKLQPVDRVFRGLSGGVL